MWTLHSQKLFFQHFINIFHCWTTISSQSMSLLSHFLSIPLITQQKERRQLQINQPNFPSGFPSTLLPSVLAATALHMLADNTTGVTLCSPATHICCCDCHTPLLLLFAFTCSSAGTAPGHWNWGHTAELPELSMPFSSGKLETHPLVCTKWFKKHRFQDLRSNMLHFERPVYSQEIPLIQHYQIKLFH